MMAPREVGRGRRSSGELRGAEGAEVAQIEKVEVVRGIRSRSDQTGNYFSYNFGCAALLYIRAHHSMTQRHIQA